MEVDVSQKAIGMALMQSVQEEHESKANQCLSAGVETNTNNDQKCIIPSDLLPVVYGSKTFTDAETCFANIKCE